jgi:hypothetical protein
MTASTMHTFSVYKQGVMGTVFLTFDMSEFTIRLYRSVLVATVYAWHDNKCKRNLGLNYFLEYAKVVLRLDIFKIMEQI